MAIPIARSRDVCAICNSKIVYSCNLKFEIPDEWPPCQLSHIGPCFFLRHEVHTHPVMRLAPPPVPWPPVPVPARYPVCGRT